jgi:hypothetical protein
MGASIAADVASPGACPSRRGARLSAPRTGRHRRDQTKHHPDPAGLRGGNEVFSLERSAAGYPSLVAAEASADMWIGNRSHTHPHMLTLASAQMSAEVHPGSVGRSRDGRGLDLMVGRAVSRR